MTTTQLEFEPEPRMLIDGKLVGARSGKQFENINPATEDVLGHVADAAPEDMRDAITAARRGLGRQNGIEGFETYLETKLMGIASR